MTTNRNWNSSKDQFEEKIECQWSLEVFKRPTRGRIRMPMVFRSVQKTNAMKNPSADGL